MGNQKSKNKKYWFTPTPILKTGQKTFNLYDFFFRRKQFNKKFNGIGVSLDYKRGFTLLEVVIASSIITASMLAILEAYSFFIRAENSNGMRVKSIYLLEEGIEASRYLRDNSWTSNILPLSTTTSYYLYFSSSNATGTWQTTTTPQIYDGVFTRKLTFGQVYRNSTTQNISTTSSGSAIDPNTRKITVQVSWNDQIGSATKSMSAYLTNINGN